jgi:hypothetical protein
MILTMIEQPSICIPYVMNNISKTYINDVFKSLNLGIINKIDCKYKKNYKMIYIHFKEWNSSVKASNIKNKLLNGELIYIIYNSGIWKCSLSIKN